MFADEGVEVNELNVSPQREHNAALGVQPPDPFVHVGKTAGIIVCKGADRWVAQFLIRLPLGMTLGATAVDCAGGPPQ